MFRIFSKALLAFLVCSFFSAHAEAKVKLSKKHIPPGNPGGERFYEDEEFAESYKLYKKRRELLKKKKLQNKANVNIRKKDLVQELRKKRVVNFDNGLNYSKACITDNEENLEDAMINQHGINIARLKGAKFIDDDSYLEPSAYQYESEKEGLTSAQEKKISPINVTIKENAPKKTSCSYDFLDDFNMSKNSDVNSQSSYVHEPDSFGSVVDTVE